MSEPITTRDHDREADFLGAFGTAFAMSGHLDGPHRIIGLSDDDARRQLAEARATMASLRPVPPADDTD